MSHTVCVMENMSNEEPPYGMHHTVFTIRHEPYRMDHTLHCPRMIFSYFPNQNNKFNTHHRKRNKKC